MEQFISHVYICCCGVLLAMNPSKILRFTFKMLIVNALHALVDSLSV